MEQIIIGLISGFAVKYPIVASVVAVVGTLRLIIKPIMVAAQAVVDATPSEKDNKVVKKVEESKFYKFLMFILDYVASVKPVK